MSFIAGERTISEVEPRRRARDVPPPLPTTGRRRPAVSVHYAQTLDGRIATRTGQSRWISCEASLRLAHQLRAEHDAVLVGVGTVVADDPRLTVRLVAGRSPLRVVVDSTLRLPLDAKVLTDRSAETLIVTTERATPERVAAVRALGVGVLVAGRNAEDRVDLEDLLARLHAIGVGSVLVEGGHGLITAILRARLLDRLVVCIAPKVVGAGVEAVGDLGIPNLGAALTFADARFRRLGRDVIFEGQLERAPAER